MPELYLADRYAEISLIRSSELISAREAPAERILDNLTNNELFAMIATYFELPAADLNWFREQFAKEDTSFSLVKNEREVRLLCASMLNELVTKGNSETILAIATTSLNGKRRPQEFTWLVDTALNALDTKAVADRTPRTVDTRVTPTAVAKLADEISSFGDEDWPSLRNILSKMRSETSNSAKTTANQTQTALTELRRQIRLQREENQILWWIIGQYSRIKAEPFSQLSITQAALMAAIDLGALTTVSALGPIAAPAMLERMIALAKRSKGTAPKSTIAAIIDSNDRDDLKKCQIYSDLLPDQMALLATAIELARTLGAGNWHGRFAELTGSSAEIELTPIEFATLLYRELLLGHLL